MQSYDPPVVPEDMTSEQATAAVNAMAADAKGDPEHPFFTAAHPQHGDWVKHVERLHEIQAGAAAETKRLEQDTAICDCFATLSTAPESLRAEAAQEMELLRGLGYDAVSIPENIEPHSVAALKMQRLNAQGDTGALAPLMEGELRRLNAPPETLETFRNFVDNAALDPELREDIFGRLISWIHKASAARFGKVAVDPDASTEDQIKALYATAGYADGTLKRTDRKRHDAITAAISALYERASSSQTAVTPTPQRKTYGRRQK